MLVLSRKAGEKICIGDGISVIVNRISGGRVTLAIEAPADVRILRGELASFAGGPEKAEPEPPANAAAVPPASGAAMTGAPTNGRTLALGPRPGGELPPALARRAMLPPGPLRQTLNKPQSMKNPNATSNVPSPR